MARYVLHAIHPDRDAKCFFQNCQKQIKDYGVQFAATDRITCVDCAKKILQFERQDAKRWLVEIEEMEGRLRELE